ncbi:hypothetical protein BJH93_03350 [Kocuria polaris]|nr:hypothetical protein [Kocuria polaris]
MLIIVSAVALVAVLFMVFVAPGRLASGAGDSACGPADKNGQLVSGMAYLDNRGLGAAVIEDVQPVDGENLEVVSWGLREMDSELNIGIGPADGISEAATQRRVEPKSQMTLETVLGLVDESKPGEASGVRVTYTDRLHITRWSVVTGVHLTVQPHDGRCF